MASMPYHKPAWEARGAEYVSKIEELDVADDGPVQGRTMKGFDSWCRKPFGR